MQLFAIHAPRASEAVAGPELGRATKTGFSFAALLFGPLWLLARGAFWALLGYAILAAGVAALVVAGRLGPGAAAGLVGLGHLYLAIEGRALAAAARERGGRPLVDVVFAGSALEAEKLHLERTLHPASPFPRRGSPPASPEVIGLFPEPGR